MRRNDAPCALHEELHQEDACQRGQRTEAGNPERHDDETAQRCGDDGAAAAADVGVVPEREAAKHGADHRQHRDIGDPRLAVADDAEERRIHVLCPVRHEIHHRHQQDEVQEALPLAKERLAVRRPVGAVFVPRFRFLHLGADEERQQRRQAADEEHQAPAIARVHRVEPRIQHPECEGREQIAHRVAFLQQAGKQAAQPRRCGFERKRRTDAPLAAHADAEQHAQEQEHAVARRKAAQHRNDGVEHDVDHQRNAATEPIGHEAEHDRAERAHGKGHRDRQRDLRSCFAERAGDVVENQREDEEVEGVERPPEKAGEHGIPLIGALDRCLSSRHGNGTGHSHRPAKDNLVTVR